MKRAIVAVLAPLACVACSHQGEMRVFVRDPHAVWVEGPTSSGRHVVLPEGGSFAQVSVPVDREPFGSAPTTATIFREANGGITIDYRACAVSPYAPLHPSGELTVVPDHDAPRMAVITSDGPNLRMAYRCSAGGSRTPLDLTLVTPWTNVREIDEYER